MTIGSVSTVFKEFQPTMPLSSQVGRQKNFIHLINPNSSHIPDSSQMSQQVFNQNESINEDGMSISSGIMQSMSSLAAGQGSASLSAL